MEAIHGPHNSWVANLSPQEACPLIPVPFRPLRKLVPILFYMVLINDQGSHCSHVMPPVHNRESVLWAFLAWELLFGVRMEIQRTAAALKP